MNVFRMTSGMQWRTLGTLVVAVTTGLYCRAAVASPAPAGEHPHGIKWIGFPTDEDPRVGFIFVLINFAILLYLLNRILFRPLMASNAKKSDTIREQLDRRDSLCVLDVIVGGRHRQRINRHLVLTGNPERRPRRHQNVTTGRSFEDPCYERRRFE